jgi:hypothetical protein
MRLEFSSNISGPCWEPKNNEATMLEVMRSKTYSATSMPLTTNLSVTLVALLIVAEGFE